MTRGTAWPHRKSVTRKQEARGWGERADGQRVSGWDDKKVLKMDRSDSCLKRKNLKHLLYPYYMPETILPINIAPCLQGPLKSSESEDK